MKARNVAQHFWESRPILNGEQPEAVEDSEVAPNDPKCIARDHPTADLSIFRSGLTKLTRFVLASTRTRWPRLPLLNNAN